MSRAALVGALAASLALASACGRGSGTGDSAAAPASGSARGAAVSGTPDCPHTGHWTECGVKLRLMSAGMVPIAAEHIDGLPSLAPKPLLYTLGGRDLAVFIFPDAASRARAMASLDTTRFIPATKSLSARGELTVIETDNLLAFFNSKNDQQRERVSDALQVGPPQP